MNANEMLNETPLREVIKNVMKNLRDFSPGKDGVRLQYLYGACDEVRMKVIGIVVMMFEKRANEWDECTKSGIIVPLFKKGNRSATIIFRCVYFLFMCSHVLSGKKARYIFFC